MLQTSSLPLVLALGGHDPSGGAGLQADIEAIAANGCRALTVVTTLTTQNTCGVRRLLPQPPSQVLEQCQLLLEESRPASVKIGLLGSAGIAQALAALLDDYPDLPLVLDPVLTSGSGDPLSDSALRAAIRDDLLPHCTLVTPNSPEARALTGEQDMERCAARLCTRGCDAVLVTGTHETDTAVINRLYGPRGLLQESRWERLPGRFHGSGCTLAAAAAAQLALGAAPGEAVRRSLKFTWNSLRHASRTGRCQYTPNRFYHFQADEH